MAAARSMKRKLDDKMETPATNRFQKPTTKQKLSSLVLSTMVCEFKMEPNEPTMSSTSSPTAAASASTATETIELQTKLKLLKNQNESLRRDSELYAEAARVTVELQQLKVRFVVINPKVFNFFLCQIGKSAVRRSDVGKT